MDAYLVLVRLTTQTEVVVEVDVLKVLSVGITRAVRFCLPLTGGFHEHVAEKFG